MPTRRKMETDGVPTLFTAYDAALLASSGAVLSEYTRAIYCGADGTVKVGMESGASCVFNVVTGLVLPVRVNKVFTASTTATKLIGLW